ncbi:M20 family metallo-hydrolase [Aureimonas fodinaquatilis]|uniref:M20 family metallo-hydrolase n=1 Tax=Aureimonas fodinaquatilis TaxID=2565783 RepID=A0A5B0DUR7_9HYPH|nr:M20 family metallo-hydrolase [Aureimonas fodinaquatilis]KAA0969531.1 M20 family metallo-hydrolase [Aureimonas fodinaquatilis]
MEQRGVSPSEFVNGERLWDRHFKLAAHGARQDGGVDRPALSAEESAARAELIGWGKSIGLTAYTDEAANLFLRLEGQEADAAPVLSGSHIDSQPTGGKFDGVFGVLAALEAVEAIVAMGAKPRRPIEVVAWMNEEGSRFSPGMAGSEAYTGVKPIEALLAVRDADGVTAGEAVAQVLARDVNVPVRPFGRPAAAFIEAHIEQGPVLEKEGIPVGIVTGIQGTRRYRVQVTGEAAHAGTANRSERKDALMAAVRMIAALDREAMHPDDLKVTVGMLTVTPNAPSVVPAQVMFSIDVRHPNNKEVDRIDSFIRLVVEAEKGPCEVALSQIAHAPSLMFNANIRILLHEKAREAGIAATDIYSAAGHDARQLHYFCPTGMIFVPCKDGISHNPNEWAESEHLLMGTQILADALWHLANE